MNPTWNPPGYSIGLLLSKLFRVRANPDSSVSTATSWSSLDTETMQRSPKYVSKNVLDCATSGTVRSR